MQTRRSFLSRLLGLPAALALPEVAAATAAPREYCFRTFRVAGFQYHAGPALIGRMAVAEALALVPEPHNPYDARAVRLDWQGTKIGYVPRRENAELHALLASGAPVSARIADVRPDAPTWEAVSVELLLRP